MEVIFKTHITLCFWYIDLDSYQKFPDIRISTKDQDLIKIC